MTRLAFVLVLWGLVGLVGLVGCGDDDATVDAGMDASMPDVGAMDAGGDVGADDAGGDAGGDAGQDAGPTEDTWESFAMEWFATYCTECHSGGRRNYTTIDEVIRDADRIRCGVTPSSLPECGAGTPRPNQFPIGDGPFPEADTRQRIVDWIDDGLTP